MGVPNIVSLAASTIFLVLVLRVQIGTQRAAIALLVFATAVMCCVVYYHLSHSIKVILCSILIFVVFRCVFVENLFHSLREYTFIVMQKVSQVAAKVKIHRAVALLALCVACLALVNSFYWDLFTARVLIYFLAAIFVISYTSRAVAIKFVETASQLHYWILLFAVVGVIYVFFGGEALFEILNEDGRKNGFYLSTFSNTYSLGFIRPSGIYDEPGALSFFVCIIIALREIFHLDRKLSWRLILLGFITSSLAHFIFFFLFSIHSGAFRLRALIKLVPIVLAVVSAMYFIDSPFSALLHNFFSRFEIIGGTISGDNRSELFLNAISYLDPSVIFFGLNGACILNLPECTPGMYVQYGENPLTLMVHLGLTLAWTYYLALIYLLIKSRGGNRWLVLGVLMLILQRPNIISYGYSPLIIMFMYTLYRNGVCVSLHIRGGTYA